MIIAVSEVPNEGFGSSVIVFTGTRESDGNVVRFGVDHRMADGLVHEILLSGEVRCEVESWAVLGILPQPV